MFIIHSKCAIIIGNKTFILRYKRVSITPFTIQSQLYTINLLIQTKRFCLHLSPIKEKRHPDGIAVNIHSNFNSAHSFLSMFCYEVTQRKCFRFFCRDPNGAVPNTSSTDAKSSQKKHDEINAPFWDTYDTINQLYLEMGK